MEPKDDPQRGVLLHPAAKLFMHYISWIATGHGIEWHPTLGDWLAGLNVLRAAGWAGALDAAIGFVDHNRGAQRLDLRDLELEWQALRAMGRQKRLDLDELKRERKSAGATKFLAGLAVAVAKGRGINLDDSQKDDLRLLGAEQAPFPPEWQQYNALDHRKSFPGTKAPYLGEQQVTPQSRDSTDGTFGDRQEFLQGWDQIRRAWAAATGSRVLSERRTRVLLDKSGVKLRKFRGRILVEKDALEKVVVAPIAAPTNRRLKRTRSM